MPAYGHGFGLRYDLPLPLMLWIIGAVSTVLLSFLIVAIAVRSNASVEAPAQLNLLHWQISKAVTGGKTRLTDRLEYDLPGGSIINRLFGWMVKLGLHRLFHHRHRVTKEFCERP